MSCASPLPRVVACFNFQDPSELRGQVVGASGTQEYDTAPGTRERVESNACASTSIEPDGTARGRTCKTTPRRRAAAPAYADTRRQRTDEHIRARNKAAGEALDAKQSERLRAAATILGAADATNAVNVALEDGEGPPTMLSELDSTAAASFRELGVSEWLAGVCRSLGLARPTQVKAQCLGGSHDVGNADCCLCQTLLAAARAACMYPVCKI